MTDPKENPDTTANRSGFGGNPLLRVGVSMGNLNDTGTKVKRDFSIIKVNKDLRDATQISDAAARLAGQMLDIVSSVSNDPDLRVCRVSNETMQGWIGKCEKQVRRLVHELEAHKIFVRIETGRNIPINITNTWIFDDAPLAALAEMSRKASKQKAKSTKDRVAEVRTKMSESRTEMSPVGKKMSPARTESAPSSGLSSLGVFSGSSNKQTNKDASLGVVALGSESETPSAAVMEVPGENRKHHFTNEQLDTFIGMFDAAWSTITSGQRAHGAKDRSNIAYAARHCAKYATDNAMDTTDVYKHMLKSFRKLVTSRDDRQAPITDPTAHLKRSIGALTMPTKSIIVEAPAHALVPATTAPVTDEQVQTVTANVRSLMANITTTEAAPVARCLPDTAAMFTGTNTYQVPRRRSS